MDNRVNRFLLIVVAVVIFYPTVATSIPLGISGKDDTLTFAAEEYNNGFHVSLAAVFSPKGYTCDFNRESGILTVRNESRTLRFYRDLPLYRMNDSLFQIPVPLEQNDTSLSIPVQVMADILAFHGIDTISRQRVTTPQLLPAKTNETGSSVNETVQPRVNLSVLPRGQKIQTIVIDPGHGGKDPGAIGPKGTQEKDIVLAVALKLRDILKESANLSVFMTRDSDRFVELRDRTRFANSKNADLFLSIHANSIGGGRKKRELVKGYKVYFLSQAKNEADERVAELENSVIAQFEETASDDILTRLFIDLAANEYLHESQNLAILLSETFESSVQKISKLHTGVGQGPFWVLYGASMPSVLIEIGFISNPMEEKTIQDSSFQREIAVAIRHAVLNFKKKYEVGL